MEEEEDDDEDEEEEEEEEQHTIASCLSISLSVYRRKMKNPRDPRSR